MCMTVRVNDTWCSNVTELRSAVFPYNPVFKIDNVRPDECLCNLDFDAMSAAMGLVQCNEEGEDPCEIIFLPPEMVKGKYFPVGS